MSGDPSLSTAAVVGSSRASMAGRRHRWSAPVSNLGIERSAAQSYIEKYFMRFSGVKQFMDDNPHMSARQRMDYFLKSRDYAGEMPAGCRCPFDSVSFAGLWLPDAATLEAARHYGGRTRQHFLRRPFHRGEERCFGRSPNRVLGHLESGRSLGAPGRTCQIPSAPNRAPYPIRYRQP